MSVFGKYFVLEAGKHLPKYEMPILPWVTSCGLLTRPPRPHKIHGRAKFAHHCCKETVATVQSVNLVQRTAWSS